ncbi:unnamed protein product [Kluyveromyces dobzhanskii CBS 2104]|uniref:WGS project CCBQ000000000 data, contig 00102 n=1 Tax=Kluyveromyces dobzhanskii CBS 2104 TaxID=1427455 RepID=A0A0A8L6G7_9SACH|nr:unnamed protein product [Kluyveromyces dobzhanskii CBS 2104]
MFSLSSSIPVVGTHGHPGEGSLKFQQQPNRYGSTLPPPTSSDSNADSAENAYSPIIHCMLAGGIGGAIGDSAMHSLDTVKTRQQGAPSTPKYKNMISAYRTIFVEEGLRKGLYGGYSGAMLGSFPSAAIFFATYELTKRQMIDEWEINETFSHLTSGFLGDFVSSFVYVPSEVLKTRLQLQGRYNNPYFQSGYNYKNLTDAVMTIIRREGWPTLFFGYKATLSRDLPFSGLQFAFYEKFRQFAFTLENKTFDEDLSLSSEIVTGAAAGGLAGIITTPLDVVKTRIQTQLPEIPENSSRTQQQQTLTSSITKGMITVYKTEGLIGLFSGVGPRFIWTSVQSSIMLLLYQVALKSLDSKLSEENRF